MGPAKEAMHERARSGRGDELRLLGRLRPLSFAAGSLQPTALHGLLASPPTGAALCLLCPTLVAFAPAFVMYVRSLPRPSTVSAHALHALPLCTRVVVWDEAAPAHVYAG